MIIRTEHLPDALHLRGYPDNVEVKSTNYRAIKVPYLFHALVIPTGDQSCFMYGLNSELTQAHFTALCDELRNLHFTAVGWHQHGVVRRLDLRSRRLDLTGALPREPGFE